MNIFLDESGDLGFDFLKKGTSKFFVICLLILPTPQDLQTLSKALNRTIKNKLNKGKISKNPAKEIKGSKTVLSVKQYFYRQTKGTTFFIYALILNKRRVYENLRDKQEVLYNYVARVLIQNCPFSEANEKIILTLDKRKSSTEISHFNSYIFTQLRNSLPGNIPFQIFHHQSSQNKGLQAVDLFAWGIFRKYEKRDVKWYDEFRKKIKFEEVYLP